MTELSRTLFRRRRRKLTVVASVISVLVFATRVSHAQNLTDTQITLVSADLADAAQLRWVHNGRSSPKILIILRLCVCYLAGSLERARKPSYR